MATQHKLPEFLRKQLVTKAKEAARFARSVGDRAGETKALEIAEKYRRKE